jgi:hypothetical protein
MTTRSGGKQAADDKGKRHKQVANDKGKNQTNDRVQTGCKPAYNATTKKTSEDQQQNQRKPSRKTPRGDVSRMWLRPFDPNAN